MSLAISLIPPAIAAGTVYVTGGISALMKGTLQQQKVEITVIAPLMAAAVTAAFMYLNATFGLFFAATVTLMLIMSVDNAMGFYLQNLIAEVCAAPFTALQSLGSIMR